MKYFKVCFFAFSLSLLLNTGCSEKGEIGPQGQQGAKGDQGEKGLDGTVILSGTTNPEAHIGKESDFFLNLSNQTLFGPKKGNNWGAGTVLSGTEGKTGQNGNTILSGKGEPNKELGNIGDFYFDIQNVSIYGAKTSVGWSSPISLLSNKDISIRTIVRDFQINLKESDLDVRAAGKGVKSIDFEHEFKVLIGDIKEYNDNGIVLIQTKINNNLWSNYRSRFEIKNSNYYFQIDVRTDGDSEYNGGYLTTKDNYAYMESSGDITDQQLKNLFISVLSKQTLSYKIILIPSSSIDKIQSNYNRKIDNAFLTNYFKMAN